MATEEKPQARSNLDRLTDWIKGLLSSKSKPDIFWLWHSTGANGGPPVRTWDISELEGVIAKDLANDILNAAKDDAQAPGGNQIYVCRAQSKADTSGPMAEVKFRVTVTDIAPMNAETSQAAVIAHLLRRDIENARIAATNTRTLVDGFKELAEGYKRQAEQSLSVVKAQNERIGSLETRNIEVMKMVEEILNFKHQREIEAKQTERDETRKDKMMTWLLTIMPTLTQKLLGNGPASSAASKNLLSSFTDEQKKNALLIFTKEQMLTLAEAMGDPKKLEGFMKSLTEEQIGQLGAMLTPEQMMLLTQLSDIVDP